MDEALKSYHITMMNLILPTHPQNPPGIELPPSKRWEVVSTDEVFYQPTDDEIMTEEKVNEVSNNLEENVVNNLPPEPNQVQQE